MGLPLRLLLVEDSEDDASLVVREFERAGYDVLASRVDTAVTFSDALERARWDLVISDHSMPRFNGMSALNLLRQRDASTPFIFVSGTLGADAASAALRSGAQEYFVKGHLEGLVATAQREIREDRSRRAQEAAEATLHACHDTLTDLPGRPLLIDRLGQAISASRRVNAPLALVVLDVDGLKSINDSLGREAGNHILQQVAARLTATLRDVDTVARIGGDEFVFLLPHTDDDGAKHAVRKVLDALRPPFAIEGRRIPVTSSCGIACLPQHGPTADELLRQAEAAMHAASASRLSFVVHGDDGDFGPRVESAAAELRAGVAGLTFVCEYEPIVSLHSESIFAVEARARQLEPQPEGYVLGDYRESSDSSLLGRRDLLTSWVLDHALAEEWPQSVSRGAITLAIRLCSHSLRAADLADRVAETLELHGVDPSALLVQVTGADLVSTGRAASCLARLRELGVRIALDDFGTDGSALEQLRRFPIDVLKIDASLVADLEAGDAPIVRAVIEMGHDLGLIVVAKGVESLRVYEALDDLLCDAVQGPFFGPPRAARKTQRWIETYQMPGDSLRVAHRRK